MQAKEFNYSIGKFKHYTKEIKGKKRFFVKGLVTTNDIDSENDRMSDPCIKDMYNQFDNRIIKLDYDHETLRDGAVGLGKSPLGKAVNKSLTANALEVEFELNNNWKKFDAKGNVVKTFDEINNEIKDGFFDAYSVAFVPKSATHGTIDGKSVRQLDKVHLLNVALTGSPINDKAKITSVVSKSLDHLDIIKKAYEKDGAHAHTEDEPLGLHNHPEIERVIQELKDDLDDRIRFIHERINDNYASEEKTLMSKKSKEGDNMNNLDDANIKIVDLEKQLKSKEEQIETLKKAEDEDDKKEEDKKDDDKKVGKGDDTPTDDDKPTDDNKDDGDNSEKEEKAMKEMKSRLDIAEKKLEEQGKILSKANHKSLGAQDSKNGNQAVSTGPLDQL